MSRIRHTLSTLAITALALVIGLLTTGAGCGGSGAPGLPGPGGGDTLPPAVTITAPANGATVSGTITISATATDDTGVTQIIVRVDGAQIGSYTTSPVSHSWDTTTVANGSHTIRVEATDAATNFGAADITVTVNNAAPPGGGTPTGGSGGGTGVTTGSYQSRGYRAYTPSSYSSSTPAPVVVLFHGLGDTYTNFHQVALAVGWQAVADAQGVIVVAPDHNNATRASFLHFNGSTFDMTATIAEFDAVLDLVYYGLGADYNVETDEIYALGFSEGAVFTDLVAWQRSELVRAAAPYAGGGTGKSFPITRDIPVYHICGTLDSGFSGVQTAYNEWVGAGHDTNNAWVSGVGHSFSGLHSSGPSASSVYQWLSTATFTTPVSSTFTPGGGGSTGGTGSGGSGGPGPGSHTRQVSVTGLGTQNYHIYVPSSYSSSTPMPILFALHGAGGSGTAPAAAMSVRDSWGTVASTNGFLVAAIEATGSGGGWLINDAVAVLNAVITAMWADYNVDTKRVYGWGFSAGGHVMHLLGLANANFFAAYGVSAGVLDAVATPNGVTPSGAPRTIPVAIHIGTSDTLLPYAQADRSTFLAAGWATGSTLQYTEFSGGHTYTTSHLIAIWGFLSSKVLP